MSDQPFVSVVVLSLNGSDVIRGCLDSLATNDYSHFETIVVNNGSTDGTPDIVRNEYPDVRLVDLPYNHGFAGGINEGLKAARGEILVPLNDDTICTSDLVRNLIQPLIDEPDAGIVGCKILYPDRKTIQHAGGCIHANGITSHFGYGEEDCGQWDEQRDVDYCTGCVIAIRRKVFEELGLFDDRYFPTYYEEVEFALRARRRGWRVVYNPKAYLYHLESKTEIRYSQKFFYRCHRSRWRFVLKNFSWRQLPRAIRAELRYIWYMGHKWYEGRALVRAYLYVLARLPFILYDRNHRFLPLEPRDEQPPADLPRSPSHAQS